jgi:small nuclear ribonucleoprotein (snRNP)-like protein
MEGYITTMIEERLKEVIDHEILVVQTDGKAFKGILVEFDKDFIMLHNCLETTTRDVKWKSVVVPVPTDDKAKAVKHEEGGYSYGETEKKVAILRKVMINLNQVQRIWLWDPEEYTPRELDDIGIVSF